MKNRQRRSVVLAIVMLLGPHAFAQSDNATLSGTIVDSTGRVVPEVRVTLLNTGTSLRRETTSNTSGYFTLALLPAGKYSLSATRDGFARVMVNDIVLNVADVRDLHIVLQVGATTQSVTVTAEGPNLNTTDGSVSTVVDRQQIANMPLNGRSLQALIQLTPGIVLTTNSAGAGNSTSGAQFSVNGNRTTSNYWTVDGVAANTGINTGFGAFVGQTGVGTGAGTTALGGTNSIVSLDALREFRIETSSYAPEFGRTPGGQISLVTRGGTNTFTGSLSYFFRNEALDANSWFANAGGQPKPKERQSLFSGVVGGPIKKDRLFLFASYEGLRLQQPRAGTVVVPGLCVRGQATCPIGLSAAPAAILPFLNAIPQPNGAEVLAACNSATDPPPCQANGQRDTGAANLTASYSDPASFNVFGIRIDGNITKNLTGFFRYNHAPSETATRTQALSSLDHISTLNDTYTGGVTWLAGKKLTADVRVNWTDNAAPSFATLDSFHGAVVPSVQDVFAPVFNPGNSVLGFSALGGQGWFWGAGNSDEQRQFNIVGTGTYLVGRHQLKFGVDYRRLLPFIGGTGGQQEDFSFTSVSNLIAGKLSSHLLVNSVPIRREPIIPELSLFVQDTWRATSRLSLTYGVRLEHMPPPGEATGQLPPVLVGIENITQLLQNVQLAPPGTPMFRDRFGFVAPRFGMAYQLSRRTGWETTLRSGVGQFYDLPFGGILDAFEFTWPYWIRTNISNEIFPGDRTPPIAGSNVPNNFTQLDPNTKLPYVLQWNAAWEQSIGRAQTITATYVGAHGYRLLGFESALVTSTNWPGASIGVNLYRNLSESSYEALQLQLNRRLSNRLQALASYTLSKSEDTLSENSARATPLEATGSLVQQWGPSSFDVRHVFSSAVSYELPRFKGTRVLGRLINGWGSDVLIRYQSAPPYNPAANLFIVVEGGSYVTQPNVVAGQPLYIYDPSLPGGRRANPAAFTRPPSGQQGNFPRNGLRGFGASQVDFALRRQFGFRERLKLQLRAELFNLFNHPNFGGIVTSISDPNFGKATQALSTSLGGLNPLYQMGGPRSGQLSVKLLW